MKAILAAILVLAFLAIASAQLLYGGYRGYAVPAYGGYYGGGYAPAVYGRGLYGGYYGGLGYGRGLIYG